ncbi:lipopolysaccharide biosynthesis protein [Pontibacter sp. HSC-36F09]|uniref:lipopolysaccharide biosynthesis protein n=1 Tax=Pontibacter sp. HSC-36F09 TaxID=2910966 RepID=UPI00209E96FD|nr:lipopolysaccharide biosynthesis protein [Pontibacter sp. HSC-36F09]MCP2043677.1 O-antigen/teichoic acid export membrane protein [Pontibacter sp. HSC-36F09]
MSLKKTTLTNLKWSFVESVSLKLIGFILTIILARLLKPSDFGILAVVNVFYLITVPFIDGGLKEALIQKKDAEEKDYSSVFWVNLIIAACFYIVLFIAAPFIEDFYNIADLSFYIRFQSLCLLIDSLTIVQVIKSTKELNLKNITQSRIPASLLSFSVGVSMAYMGFGVVALITQQLVNSICYVVLLWMKIKYRPSPVISRSSIRSLYSFGIKVFAAGYLNRIYVQSMSLIYAKFFSPALLGLYNKANNLQQLPASLILTSVANGVYPTMVKIQDNNSKLKELYKKNIQVSFGLICCLSVLFFYQADNVISILLGEAWMGMVPYTKIVAVGGLFLPMSSLNRNILKVKGQAGLFLKLELWRKVLIIVAIIIFIRFSFITTLISVTTVSFLMTLVDMHFAGKNINYYLKEQITDILPFFFIISFVGLSIDYVLSYTQMSSIVELTIFSLSFSALTGLIIFLTQRRLVGEIMLLLK